MPQLGGRTLFHRSLPTAATPPILRRRRLIMLNIDAKTSIQHACLMHAAGETLATGSITFRSARATPVALTTAQLHVMAVGDIVEPIEAWRTYKHEQTGRIGITCSASCTTPGQPTSPTKIFARAIEIANVTPPAATSQQGHVRESDGDVYLMYTTREVASPLMRDKFFPGSHCRFASTWRVVRDGQVLDRKTLIEGSETSAPGDAKFTATPDGRLWRSSTSLKMAAGIC